MPFKDFTAGEILTAVDVDNFLMRQTVMVFDDVAARTTALTDVLVEGMVSYLKTTSGIELYNGTGWVSADSEIPNQSGQSGKYLSTDGTVLSWGDVDALPSQAGQSGKYLSTDGTNASWDEIIIPPTTSPNPQIFLLMGA